MAVLLVDVEAAWGALFIPAAVDAAAAAAAAADADTDAAAEALESPSLVLALRGGSGELLFKPRSVSGSFFKLAILLVRLLGTTCFMSLASRSMRSCSRARFLAKCLFHAETTTIAAKRRCCCCCCW